MILRNRLILDYGKDTVSPATKIQEVSVIGDGGKISSFRSATDPKCVIIVNKLRSFMVP